MKRRGWRVALTVATLGLALVAGLVLFNWGTVRDHAEAWWFVWTRETADLRPGHDGSQLKGEVLALQRLSTYSGHPVIYDPAGGNPARVPWDRVTPERILKISGYRVIQQRFPRVAYVVIGLPQTKEESRWVERQKSRR